MAEAKKLSFVDEQDVETQVFDWGRLAWLSEPRVTAAAKFSAGVVTLEPGKGHDRHNHPGVEEILYFLEGKARQMVEIDGKQETREVGPGVLIHIPPDVFHSTINVGKTPVRILAVYAPPGPEAELRRAPGVRIDPPKRGRA
jgi:oxalate decarboxylase/phosphoglucose isomerase-like protein (cupin superfamily)